jgi:hypothetical protein
MGSNPQRLAWITLFGALAVFCLLCVSTVVFARWLVFDSPTQLNVVLKVGRNTVSLSEPDSSDEKAKRGTATIGQHDTLSTDNVSQGYLEFSDPYSGQIIATVTLRNDSVLTLQNASRPRFSLSDNPYAIHLKDLNGRVEVWVTDDLDRELRLDVEAALGIMRVGEPGHFLIDSTPGYLIVTVLDGSATLLRHDREARHLAASNKGIIRLDTPGIEVSQGPVDLVAIDRSTEDWRANWACAFTPSPQAPNAPSGAHEFIMDDGRPTIHIQRLQPDPGPGRTGCVRWLAGDEGLDVSQYSDLYLRVGMKVLHQQLSACGEQGSECPVMLHMLYLDQADTQREWYHGFYTDYTPNVGRTRCGSCLEEHERINKDAWYTYESANLFTLLPEGLRPSSIIALEFYAEGHQYDVMLNEVSLLANQSDSVTASR